MLELNKIYNMDCIEGMKLIPDGSIDLTVTSPPYDNLRTYNWYSWDFERVAKELYRITKQWGVIVWVVGDATVKGSETCTSFKQALYFKETGFNLHDTMIWRKTTPVPQFKCNRYTSSFEYMFVFSKGKPLCNYLTTKCKTAGNKKNRNNKGSFSMNSADRPRDEITITKENKILDNVWDYPVGGHKDIGHPAIFPEKLAEDHIISWSNEWDTVLDPFMWSWTVAKVAIDTKRNFIWFELDEWYFNIANDRIRCLEK